MSRRSSRRPAARRLRPTWAVPLLVILAFGLSLAAWVGGTPAGHGPDEPANYLRAVGAGTGQWLGRPAQLPNIHFGGPAGQAQRNLWINRNSRSFAIPAGLTPDRFSCYNEAFTVKQPTTCVDRVAQDPRAQRRLSYVGTYQPFVYAVPGVVMAHMPDALSALYAGRAVLALLALVLLGGAVMSAWDSRTGALSLVGVLLAGSPMVLFLSATLGANGLEVTGALCVYAVVLRASRSGVRPRWLWPLGTFAVVATVLSRPTGLAWVLVAVVLAAAVTWQRSTHVPRPTPRDALRLARARLGWLALVGAAVAGSLAWNVTVQPSPALDLGLAARSLKYVPEDLYRMVREWVGDFGWDSVPLAPPASWLWLFLVLALLAAAAVISGVRARVVLGGTVVLVFGAVVALDVLVFRQTYFPVYGRYLLPIVVVIPLLAGELLVRRADRIRVRARRGIAVLVAVAVAGVQGLSLYTMDRRSAVGIDGPHNFLRAPAWTPPGGWAVYVALAVAGSVALVIAALIPGKDIGAGAIDPIDVDRRKDDSADRPVEPGQLAYSLGTGPGGQRSDEVGAQGRQ